MNFQNLNRKNSFPSRQKPDFWTKRTDKSKHFIFDHNRVKILKTLHTAKVMYDPC